MQCGKRLRKQDVKTPVKAVVLKLGVATLLRVANCQKRVTKFDTKKKLTCIA